MALHGSLVSGAKFAVCCCSQWGSGGRLFGERRLRSVWAVRRVSVAVKISSGLTLCPLSPYATSVRFLKVPKDDGLREAGTHQFTFRPLAITFDAFVNMTGNLDGNRYRFFNHLLLVVVIDSFVADVAGKNLNGSVEDDQFIFMQIDINFVTHGRGLSG